jgi:type I restriction enzyme S subunit
MWRDWKETNLAQLAEYINGYAFKPSDWGTRGLPIIRIAQITGTSDLDNFYSSPLPEKFKIRYGDFIFSWSGTLAVVEWKKRDGWLNQHLFKVIPSKNLNRRFFFHIIKNSVEEMTKKAHGSTMHHIKRGELVDFILTIPQDTEEQEVIAEVLDTVDEAIDATQDMLTKQERIKDGLLQDLLTRGVDKNGKLRPPYTKVPELYKQSPLGMIPKEWESEKAVQFCLNVTDGTHDSPQPAETGYPLITSKNLKNGKLDWSNISYVSEADYKAIIKRSVVEVDDILFGMIGTIGEPAIISKGENEIAPKNVGIFRMNGDKIKSKFLFYYLNSDYINLQIRDVLAGSTQSFVGLGTLRDFVILDIPNPEIIKIIEKLDTHRQAMQNTLYELSKLKKLKSGLMQDLLTGKKRIPLKQEKAA